MNINRTALLAGVATLALMVGTGFASAQEQQKGHNAAPLHAAQPHASQPTTGRGNTAQPQGGANHAVPHRGQAVQQTPRDRKDNGRVGQSRAQPGAAATGQRAQGVNRANKSNNEGTTAQERHIPPGLQGNASGQHHLSEEQRTHIRQTLIDPRGARRVGHVDFDVRVGTQIGRGRIHLIQVPDTLVQIDPEWKGFLYFVYEDEIVVVDPSDMEIVAILPV